MFKILLSVVTVWSLVMFLVIHYRDLITTKAIKMIIFGASTLLVASLILALFVGVF